MRKISIFPITGFSGKLSGKLSLVRLFLLTSWAGDSRTCSTGVAWFILSYPHHRRESGNKERKEEWLSSPLVLLFSPFSAPYWEPKSSTSFCHATFCMTFIIKQCCMLASLFEQMLVFNKLNFLKSEIPFFHDHFLMCSSSIKKIKILSTWLCWVKYK